MPGVRSVLAEVESENDVMEDVIPQEFLLALFLPASGLGEFQAIEVSHLSTTP